MTSARTSRFTIPLSMAFVVFAGGTLLLATSCGRPGAGGSSDAEGPPDAARPAAVSPADRDAGSLDGALSTTASPTAGLPLASTGPVAEPLGFKIGVMTGTVSQGEDGFRAGEMLARRYGPAVRHVTYPDNFMQEQETLVAQLVGLAADPKMKVIVMSQAVPGAIAGARKIKEQRPDILIGFVNPQEDPVMVNEIADIAIQADEVRRGRTIVEHARKMGAKTFVHYSFPRHMSQELIARRRDLMKQTCAENGMTFQFVTAPDPTGEGGLPATQQFILEDVPRELAKYGPDTAFFSTNCGMQDPLIKSVLTHGGYMPEQCCPSPTHGYPTALGIGIPPDKAGDMAFINAENRRVIGEHGMTGHFGTWPVPEEILATLTEAELLADHVAKQVDYKDPKVVADYLTARAGVPVTISRYDPNEGNQYLMLIDYVTY
jgi:hypothetical protein